MALYGALAENVRRNERVDRGIATFTGSITITLPQNAMRQIFDVLITQVIGVSPGVGPAVFTYTIGASPNGNQFTIFAWQPTSNANPTLVAGTSAATVSWQARGSLGPGF